MCKTMLSRTPLSLVILGTIAVLITTACGTTPSANNASSDNLQPDTPDATTEPVRVAATNPDIIQSEEQRQAEPDTTETELTELTTSNSTFAFDLYQELRETEGNLFYSPHSISLALAMTYAGANGETSQQMADTLHFTLPSDRLHPAFNALDLSLTSRADAATPIPDEEEPPRFQLNIANALWGQNGYEFLPTFLDTLAQNYGAGLQLLDFQAAPEESRVTINDWISEQTEEKIQDLIPSGAIDPLTRLVLTNAIYFNAAWTFPFQESATQDDAFTLLDGGQVTVPMMAQTEDFRYAEGAGYQAVQLPYGNNVSMMLLLPEAGQFTSFEETLDAAQIQTIFDTMERQEVILTMPKFEITEASFSLKDVLTTMGMSDAFVAGTSDFSGMDGTRDLFIADVIHQASITVDEEGTEAAAATAVLAEATAEFEPQPPVEMRLDRPFIFLIRDGQTGAILFVGRVVDL